MIAAAVLIASIFASIPAVAGTFTLDGMMFEGASYTDSKTVYWYNGHSTDTSIYGDPGNLISTTTVYWGVGPLASNPGGEQYMFVFIEVPLYAKNMIWADNWNYPPFTTQDFTEYGKELDYKGATGSEKMDLGTSSQDKNGKWTFKTVFEADFAEGNYTNAYGIIGFQDSARYLLNNSLATQALSLNRNTTMSFELQFALDSTQNANFLALFDNPVSFHLSPERVTESVPEPATLLLIGSGLLGLAVFGKKYKK